MRVNYEAVKLPLDYDPYEEDCCGCFTADKANLQTGDLVLTVTEQRSGIGNQFTVTASHNGKELSFKLVVYEGDGDPGHVYECKQR